MSFWSRIANILKGGSGKSGDSRHTLKIYVLSRRCNEPIAGQVDLSNELSRTEDGSGHPFYTRKVLHTSGKSRCFAEIEVNLWFDQNRRLADHEVEGGRWLTEEEYQAELARFNAPPPQDPTSG